MSEQLHPSCVGDYETISESTLDESICPSCKKKGTLFESVMQEENKQIKVKSCSDCKWWG